MNMTPIHTLTVSNRRGFTRRECLVVISILGLLTAVLIPWVASARKTKIAEYNVKGGVGMYKAIFSKVLDDPDSPGELFPSATKGFTSSTQYFVHLVTNRTLHVSFDFFSGPGLPRYSTDDPAQFKADGNQWSVVLDVQEEVADYPFLLHRNLLPAATNVPPKSAALTLDMLGETGKGRKLDFNTHSATVITRAGSGFLLKRKDFTGAPGSMSRLHPSDVIKPILRP
jgi:type II secretory pathway pseudopilin PulG